MLNMKSTLLTKNESACVAAALTNQLDMLMDVVEYDTNEEMRKSAYEAANTLHGVIEKMGLTTDKCHWCNERHTKHSMM